MTRGTAAGVAAGVAGMFAVALAGFGLVVFAALGGALARGGCGGDGRGSQQIGPRTWSAEQTANAQLITAAAITARLPRRAAVIAVATAIVESGLRNLPGGHADSVGLFQQRPSQGWGPVAQILNPAFAATEFYAHLQVVPGWQSLPPGRAEQAVQRSAFPDRYAPQEPAAADLVARFWTGPNDPAAAPPPAAGADLAAAAQLGAFGCPDTGGANVPRGPATLDAHRLPAGFTLPADTAQRAALTYALAQVGKPYVWGAEGPNAFDCSGLMQAAYAAAGIAISRTTTTQVHDGTPVAGIDQLTPGDLLFIPGADGTPARPGHVGMYAGDGVIVDAYDSTKGVILEASSAWRDKIVSIRHITGPIALPGAGSAGGAA